jgi:hypothetical protein
MRSALFIVLFLFASCHLLIAADNAPDVASDIVAVAQVEKTLSEIDIAPASLDIVSPTAAAQFERIKNDADRDEVPLADQNLPVSTHQFVAIEADDWDTLQLTLKIEPPAKGYHEAIIWTDSGVTGKDFAVWQMKLDASWAKRTADADGVIDVRKPSHVADDTAASADQVGPPQVPITTTADGNLSYSKSLATAD